MTTGKSNQVANALSRQEEVEVSMNSLTVIKNPIVTAILKANSKLDELQDLHKLAKLNS